MKNYNRTFRPLGVGHEELVTYISLFSFHKIHKIQFKVIPRLDFVF